MNKPIEIRPAPKSFPVHLRKDKARYWLLYRWANYERTYWGVPIYLCGSALRDDNPEPRDWDIRVEIPDDDFALRFGNVEQWLEEGSSGNWTRIRFRWSDACTKAARQWRSATHLNVDFQVYPESVARKTYKGKKKIQLDTFPKK